MKILLIISTAWNDRLKIVSQMKSEQLVKELD